MDLRPMLAVPGVLPAEGDDAWSAEVKWDGVRVLVSDRRVTARSGRDVTASYPDVASSLPRGVLDGEVVAFDVDGRPSFALLQRRMHVRTPTRALLELVPVRLMVFDVLVAGGEQVMRRSYDDRRALLETLDLPDGWQVPPAFPGGAHELAAATRAQGLEGVVVKRRASPYQPGVRSPDWRKVKNLRTQEVVIGGWAPGEGRRTGVPGALLLGLPDGDRLRYVGNVGTGFTAAMLEDMARLLEPLATPACPFAAVPAAQARTARWVRPELVGEVVFNQWTPDGRLRQPSWRGLRPDKSPGEVGQE